MLNPDLNRFYDDNAKDVILRNLEQLLGEIYCNSAYVSKESSTFLGHGVSMPLVLQIVGKEDEVADIVNKIHDQYPTMVTFVEAEVPEVSEDCIKLCVPTESISETLIDSERTARRSRLLRFMSEITSESKPSLDRKAMFIILLAQYLTLWDSGIEYKVYGDIHVCDAAAYKRFAGRNDMEIFIKSIIKLRGAIVTSLGASDIAGRIEAAWCNPMLKQLCDKLGIGFSIKH